MEGTTMRNIAELIARHHRGDRDYNRTGQHAAFDTTVEDDLGGTEGFSSGDAGCDPNSSGQGGDNLPG
jgi:hypothetical protein